MTLIRRLALTAHERSRTVDPHDDPILSREWLVTNGLGGYASGTVSGAITRRFHGTLIASFPGAVGRLMMLNHVAESVLLADGHRLDLDAQERPADEGPPRRQAQLVEFLLEDGLPRWRYDLGDGIVLDKRLMMPHRQNTVIVTFELVASEETVRIELEPWLNFRRHEGPLEFPLADSYAVTEIEGRYEVSAGPGSTALRMHLEGSGSAFSMRSKRIRNVSFGIEASRGYDATGDMYTPGAFRCELSQGQSTTLTASCESWDVIDAMTREEASRCEASRRARLFAWAAPSLRSGLHAEMVLAADQFLIEPPGRIESSTRTRASGDEPRTVIAGYHWFTDWGRDTMISLEGLTLVTGRFAEARDILGTFSRYVRKGLIPNLFPEGASSGLYHTADATLWFFHAVDRYVAHTGDRGLLKSLLPTLISIAEHHRVGTLFGIGVDPRDGLLTQGTPELPLTWMDAKVGDLIVTPRRGKAVELNALYYNALRLLAGWIAEADGAAQARPYLERAELTRASFNARFWYAEGGYLYDIVDGEQGDDHALRPNQVFSISLPHPVLEESRWDAVVSKVEAELVTPLGLRLLGPREPDYKACYFGDLSARDRAYHQGTVWAWLIGPFVDAWLKVHPSQPSDAAKFLEGFASHLNEACVGSISEVFDAKAPYTARGCIAQAWSVAEVLRAFAKVGALGSG